VDIWHNQQEVRRFWNNSSTLKTPENMRLLSLPPYSQELNPVEHFWDKLREKAFGNIVFDSLDALEDHWDASVRVREHDTPRVHSIVAWPWIMSSLLI
jgi:transposase